MKEQVLGSETSRQGYLHQKTQHNLSDGQPGYLWSHGEVLIAYQELRVLLVLNGVVEDRLRWQNGFSHPRMSSCNI